MTSCRIRCALRPHPQRAGASIQQSRTAGTVGEPRATTSHSTDKLQVCENPPLGVNRFVLSHTSFAPLLSQSSPKKSLHSPTPAFCAGFVFVGAEYRIYISDDVTRIVFGGEDRQEFGKASCGDAQVELLVLLYESTDALDVVALRILFGAALSSGSFKIESRYPLLHFLEVPGRTNAGRQRDPLVYDHRRLVYRDFEANIPVFDYNEF